MTARARLSRSRARRARTSDAGAPTGSPQERLGGIRRHPRVVTLGLSLLAIAGLAALLRDGPEPASGRSVNALPAGPLDGSVIGTARLPDSPPCGPNGPVIWLRDARRLPAAPIVLFLSAGIPVCVVRTSQSAFTHPLVMSWPTTRFNDRQRGSVCRYLSRGGTFLAVDASLRARTVLGRTVCGSRLHRSALYSRIENVPESGYVSGGHLRDRQIESLRRFWVGQEAGFRLGDAPAGARAAVAIVHDVRSVSGAASAARYLARERSFGLRSTFALQTRVLDDAIGRSLLTPELRSLARAVREAGGAVATAGVAGGSLLDLPTGVGRESYPEYTPAFATVTELTGASLFGELRVGRYLAGELAGARPSVFAGQGERTGRGFAAVAEAAGLTADATLSTSVANGAFPFFQTESGGTIRDVVRFPVSYQNLPGEHDLGALEAVLARNLASGAPTVAVITPDGDAGKLVAEERIVRALPTYAWSGTLDELARFVRARARVGIDAKPVGRRSNGWIVWLTAATRTAGQSLVAPFEIGRAVDQDGHALTVLRGRTVVLPTFTGRIAVNVAPRLR